jgi:hypothetical protein
MNQSSMRGCRRELAHRAQQRIAAVSWQIVVAWQSTIALVVARASCDSLRNSSVTLSQQPRAEAATILLTTDCRLA